MKEIQIESSNIKSIFYLEQKKELYIFFKSNHMYIYDCDYITFDKFYKSKDKDKFFQEKIKNLSYLKKY